MIYANSNTIYNRAVKINPSEAEKYANDMELAKRAIDSYVDRGVDVERINRLREEIELHSGRWKAIEDLQTGTEITVDDETFTIGALKVRHYDKIGRITRGMHGAFIAAPLVAIWKDISSQSKSIADKMKLEAVREHLFQQYLEPKINIITKQELFKVGAENMFELNPEQQMQIQSQISQRIQKEGPEEILAALEKIKTPTEQVCNLFFKYLNSQEKLKHKYDIGSEFALANGEEYYRPCLINGLPKLEVLIPEGVSFDGSPHIEFVEDATFATYRQMLSIEDVIARFGLGFLKGDLENIDQYYTTGYGDGYTGNSVSNRESNALVEIIGKDPDLRNRNFLTRDNQQLLNALYARIGNKLGNFKVPHRYATWRWQAKFKAVTRIYNGKPKEFIVAGHYTKNPKTDLKVRSFMGPQVWEGDRLGINSYHGIQAMPHQYNSTQDIFYPKLGIFGGMYNTLLGTTKNYSLIGNGKIWNYRYDVIMARMEEMEATDHGRLALLTLNAKPDGISWQDWINGILTTKIGIVKHNSEFGFSDQEKKVFQTIDMSKLVDAAGIIQKLQYAESEIHKAMFYSEANAGNIGQYSTNQNASLQIDASDRQLLSIYNRHRTITSNVSYQMLKLALIAYKDNDPIKNAVLDDFLKAHYELNMSEEDLGQYAVVLVDTISEMKDVKRMTDLALAFVQNGIINLRELSRLFSATTMSEAQDIIDESEAQRQKEKIESFATQKELESQNAKYKEDLMKLKMDFDAMQKDLDRKVKLTMAEMNSKLMANAQDIDGNKINDSIEKAREENELKKEMHDEEMAFKYAELNKSEKTTKR